MDEQTKAGFKRCLSCKELLPISHFWRKGTEGKRKASCRTCLRQKSKNLSGLTNPVVIKIIDLLKTNGPMTSDEMSDYIPDRTSLSIGNLASKMRKNGHVDCVKAAVSNKAVIWFIPGQPHPEPPEPSRRVTFDMVGLDDDSDLDVEDDDLQKGITQDDLRWMEKYRQQAELKKNSKKQESKI